jgi:hypothetical protein
MAKRVRFHVIDVATGPEWAVVLMYDSDARCWVVAWDSPAESCRRDVTWDQGRPFAQQLFEATKDEVAGMVN